MGLPEVADRAGCRVPARRKGCKTGGMGDDRLDSVRRLSACVRSKQEDIRESWRSRIKSDPDVPTTGMTALELDDHVPELLEQIVTALDEFAKWRDDPEGRGEKAGSGPVAMRHVRLRTRQGYDLSQVLRELHHLRGAIVDRCEEELVHFGGDPARIVHDAIDAAMTLAALNREHPASG
jgi:hypothetical protein